MKNDMGIEKIYIIIGANGEQIVRKFGDGSDSGLSIEYIRNENPEKGLADGILLAEKYISSALFISTSLPFFITIILSAIYLTTDKSCEIKMYVN